MVRIRWASHLQKVTKERTPKRILQDRYGTKKTIGRIQRRKITLFGRILRYENCPYVTCSNGIFFINRKR